MSQDMLSTKSKNVSAGLRNSNRVYCSLDIETSGFDPLKNEVLEVGLVFFEVAQGSITSPSLSSAKERKTAGPVRVIDEWTSVFKAKHEVPPQILALTGITQAELDGAPDFEEYKQELRDKLKHAVIVGHNVQFDIKFLESLGIEFSGSVIDTLDLVQFILPTHHSYNLENLTHIFAVEHKNAHRALADARASLEVLEKMMGVYSGFPASLQKDLRALAEKNSFPYSELLKVGWTAIELAAKKPRVPTKPAAVFSIKPGHIYDVPAGSDCIASAAQSLAGEKKKSLLVLPKASQVMQLWASGAVQALFSPASLFDEKKFAKLLKRKDLSADEAKFCMKILVWQRTNWQSACLLDLNLSFFGGQFKQLVTADELPEPRGPGVLCCDMETFQYLASRGLCKTRFAVVVGLSEFEQSASATLSIKASWSYIAYILKGFYNPDSGSGSAEHAGPVTEALGKADLFFGLVHALLSSEGQSFEYKKITPDALQSQNFQKVAQAAEHFIADLTEYNKKLKSPEISTFIENLQKFFEFSENAVQWIELAEARCVLFSSPLDIHEPVKALLKKFKSLAFVDGLHNPKLAEYFIQRLGLAKFVLETPQAALSKSRKQGDLFSMLKEKLHLKGKAKITCHLSSQPATAETIYAFLQSAQYPAAVLFPSLSQVREFQEKYHDNLKKDVSMLVQNSSGGGNKIFHNFSIRDKSLLLATGKFILKHQNGSSNVSPVEHLPVKTLIICTLPFENYGHPYEEAVSARLENAFEDHSLPKAVYNFHMLLDFFYSSELEHVYVCDSKLGKTYAGAFRDYLKQIPSLELVDA